ncbi:ubiquitin carboxyl-terminal hydrolase 12-like isoform X2 [Salarias fasciatus]|uniref:ubiquitin carboxyl-terminal hydrolase 12-like isoform X2 n=2 Tax=Salarias fasciatus TaxID=181472 RepID=UPI00117684D0|nr:ubiquitin carboxyl-terminal hydrolase 12-like isoform X2 [Salarias fasciatus]
MFCNMRTLVGDLRSNMVRYRQINLGEVKTEEMEKRNIYKRETQPFRPRHPLINQGATCYLSSILQVLFMTPEIHHRLNPSNTLDQQLELTFNNLKEGSCGTENITDSLGIKNVYQQRDAAECLERILNEVSPEASQVFKGQLKDTTRCSNGHMIIEETSPFFTLPLSLQGGHEAPCSLKTSFSEFFLRTEHTGDDMVYCTECSRKTEGSSGYEMVDFPQIMTLLLKRFYFDFNTMSDMKSNCCVEVPFKIQAMNKSYTLYGMVNHMGSLGGGHYTATVWSRENNTWYHCDDAQVTEVHRDQKWSNRSLEAMRRTGPVLHICSCTELQRGGSRSSSKRRTNPNPTNKDSGGVPSSSVLLCLAAFYLWCLLSYF